MESLQKAVQDLELAQKEITELKAVNKTLQNESDEKSVAVELMENWKKQHEQMVKENADLKAALFEAENSMRSSVSSADSVKIAAGDKKLQVIEEIRTILAEVIYSYKTMATNAKMFKANFEDKKSRVEEFLVIAQKLANTKKKEEQNSLIAQIASELAFLKGFGPKSEPKIIVPCINALAEKKNIKNQKYDDEIAKYTTMIDVSEKKVTEYEERLAFYY